MSFHGFVLKNPVIGLTRGSEIISVSQSQYALKFVLTTEYKFINTQMFNLVSSTLVSWPVSTPGMITYIFDNFYAMSFVTPDL